MTLTQHNPKALDFCSLFLPSISGSLEIASVLPALLTVFVGIALGLSLRCSLRWWRFVAICDWYKIDLSAVNVKDYFIYFKS